MSRMRGAVKAADGFSLVASQAAGAGAPMGLRVYAELWNSNNVGAASRARPWRTSRAPSADRYADPCATLSAHLDLTLNVAIGEAPGQFLKLINPRPTPTHFRINNGNWTVQIAAVVRPRAARTRYAAELLKSQQPQMHLLTGALMNHPMVPVNRAVLSLAMGLTLASALALPARADEPVVQTSTSSSALKSLGAKPLEQRVAVTIYEFHGGSPNVSVAAATDMFTNALIESGQFRVVERQRLAQGVLIEKQLNAAGQTTGAVAQKQLRGAQYIFEGTVSEANAGESQKQGGINVGGLNLGGGKNKDSIAVDVRVLDADTGDVLDSVSVSKALDGNTAGVSGTAALVGTLAAMRGKVANPLTPDVSYQTSHQEGVDKALRACIESAVLALIKRTGNSAGGAQ